MSPDRWLEIAFAELADAVREVPGPASNPRILEYGAVTTLKATSDEVPWCSSFVCWVMEQAGFRSTRSAMARSWLRWSEGADLQLARMGAITILRRGEPGSNQGHVGFLLTARANKVALLGGNQGDSVSVEWFDADRVLGFRWPKGV